MKFGLFKGIAIAGLAMTMLSSCSGGNCTPNESLSLSLTAPNQYPAGIASTAYLTITNTSGVVANNLYYTIPAETNTTGVDNITVQNGVDKQPCINIAAHDSCTFPVDIAAGSVPGSFKVVATPDGQPTVSNKVKSLFSLKAANYLELTANIGLTELQSNEEIGANGITFLYSKILPANANGSTPVDIVAVVNSQLASSCGLAHGLNRPEPQCPFNTINLTDQAGNLLDFRVLSANSGTGYSDLAHNAIVTFRLTVPQGTTSLSFYAQTMKDSTFVNQGTIPNLISLTTKAQGIVEVSPTYFKLSAVDNYVTQTITYTNTGNAEVTDLNVQTPQSPITISENNCTANLAVGSSCTLKLVSSAESGVSGTGSLKATYNGETAIFSQYEYKGLNPESGISLSAANNFDFNANTVVSSESTQVTLTNTGNVNESNFEFAFNPSYFTLSAGNGLNSCTINGSTITTTLAAGQRCTFTLTYTKSTVASGSYDIVVNYKYKGYDILRDAVANKSANYATTQATASLNVSPNPKDFGTIIANNSDDKVETFTLTNNGVDSAESVFVQTTQLFAVQNNTCSSTLASGESCTFQVKFGPTATESANFVQILPIIYSSATDASHTPTALYLNVNGAARAPLSANIQISAVTYTSSKGNGKVSDTAFQIESKNATTAVLTLTYKNVGSFSAGAFTVATDGANLPSGYSLDNNGNQCNQVTLATNATCEVKLKLSTQATGTKDINLATTLKASWTNERGQQSNHIKWNTGTKEQSTQSTIYVNVYAAPYITVSSSATSVAPSESVIFTFNLYGGYNVQAQTLRTESPNSTDITLEDSPCSVSSSSASCTTKAIFAASITPESYTFTFNNNGGDVPLSPESLVVSVANSTPPVLYITPIKTLHPADVFSLEITSTPNSTFTVTLPTGFSSTDGSTFTCNASPTCKKDITVGNSATAGYYTVSTSVGNQITIPVAVVKNIVYIPNSITSGLQVEVCNFSSSGFSACANANASIGSNKAYGVTVSATGEYAYIATDGGVYKCSIDQADKSLDSCTYQSNLGSLNTRLGAISTNGKYFYVNSRGDSTVMMCQISSIDGSLTSCITAKSGLTSAVERLVLDYNGNNLFVNTGSGTQSCSINNANGTISSCKSSGFTSAATGISYNLENTRMYFTQVSNAANVSFCNYNNSTQLLSSCVDAFNSGSKGTSGWMTGISFSPQFAFISTVSDIYSCPIDNTTGYLTTCSSAAGSSSSSAEGITVFN